MRKLILKQYVINFTSSRNPFSLAVYFFRFLSLHDLLELLLVLHGLHLRDSKGNLQVSPQCPYLERTLLPPLLLLQHQAALQHFEIGLQAHENGSCASCYSSCQLAFCSLNLILSFNWLIYEAVNYSVVPNWSFAVTVAVTMQCL